MNYIPPLNSNPLDPLRLFPVLYMNEHLPAVLLVCDAATVQLDEESQIMPVLAQEIGFGSA